MKHQQKNIKFLLLFIIICCIPSIKNDPCTDCIAAGIFVECTSASGCGCTNYKPKYINGATSYQCYDCGIIGDYYTIESNGNCRNDCQGDKILFDLYLVPNKKQCTSEIISGYKYQLGDVYYFSNDPSFSIDTGLMKLVSGSLYECKLYFTKENINGKIKYNCYDSDTITDLAPPDINYYLDWNTGELFTTGCPSGLSIKKSISFPSNSPTITIIRCSDSCLVNEYYKRYDNGDIIEESCLDKCVITNPDGFKYIYVDNGIKKCLKACPEGTYEKDKTDNGESYILCLSLDQCNFYEGNKCYDQCPDGTNGSPLKQYHNYGNKLCIPSCVTPNKFHANDGYICYPSCKDIQNGNYIYEYASDDICYASKPGMNCDNYYIKANGIKKCSDLNTCITLNKKYLIGDECTESCDGYYQVEDGVATGDTIAPNGAFKCFTDFSDLLTVGYPLYCDLKINKCWISPKTGYFIKTTPLGSSTSNKYEIVTECDRFYYVDTDSYNKCIDNCQNISPTPGKYFVSGNKKCLSQTECVSEFNKYYYDPENNECLDSCKGRPTNKFQNMQTGTPSTLQQCLSICTGFHDYDSNICINSCGTSGSK